MKKWLIILTCVLAHTQFYALDLNDPAVQRALNTGARAGDAGQNTLNANMGTDAALASSSMATKLLQQNPNVDQATLDNFSNASASRVQASLDNGGTSNQAFAGAMAMEKLAEQRIPLNDPRYNEFANQAENIAAQTADLGGTAVGTIVDKAVGAMVAGNSPAQIDRLVNNTASAMAAQADQGIAQMSAAGNVAALGTQQGKSDELIQQVASESANNVSQNFANGNSLVSTGMGAAAFGDARFNGQSSAKAQEISGNVVTNMTDLSQVPGMGLSSMLQAGVTTAQTAGQGMTLDQQQQAAALAAGTNQRALDNGLGLAAAETGAGVAVAANNAGNPNAIDLGLASAGKTQSLVDQGASAAIAQGAGSTFGTTLVQTGNEQTANNASDIFAISASQAEAKGQGTNAIMQAGGTAADTFVKAGVGQQQGGPEQQQGGPEQQQGAQSPEPVVEQQPQQQFGGPQVVEQPPQQQFGGPQFVEQPSQEQQPPFVPQQG